MINRVTHKESAKATLKQNGNQSGMIGMEILYMVMKNLTVGAVMAMVGVGIWGTYGSLLTTVLGSTLSSLLSFDNLYYSLLGYGYYNPLAHVNWFGLILVIVLGLLLIPVMAIIGAAVAAPFEVARARYYLYLRKNGIRTNATCIFESFDFFMQFALVAAAREIQVLWIPVVILLVTILLSIIFIALAVSAGSSAGLFFALFVLFVGCVAAIIVKIYRQYQFWPLIWAQADHPQMPADQLFNRCIEMTRGHVWDLIVFDLSYIGWNILNSFTGNLLALLYVTPYYDTASSYIYEELKGRGIALDGIKANMDGNGMTIGVKPKDLINIKGVIPERGNGAAYSAKPALRGVTGMYAGSEFPLNPNQPVLLGRDSAVAQIVFSTGAQKISRRHCEIMFDARTQQYRVTDYSTNGTYVNGSRLPANMPQMLARGTNIALGDNNNILSLV